MRIRLDLAYDGTAFSGWARQPGLRTVQGVVEATIAQVLRLDQPPATVCAGRTDAGVHARGQVIHFDLDDPLDEVTETLTRRLPRALPADIAFHQARPVSTDFDARFSALQRHYVYRLWDPNSTIDPLMRGFVVTYPHRLDVAAMAEAAHSLLGVHDFAAFCRPKPGGTTIRHLRQLSPGHQGDMIEIQVTADAFCHSMVRSLVGALVAIGRGLRDTTWLRSHLQTQERANDITVMPAHGLTLEQVTYPNDRDLAARAHQARSRRDDNEGI
ncbi:MAG: tRNA pseudouridine(38-40) synthase TruA [Propionibacteriaceae bacterium]|jgi:tRNA pseudouridine38-40 synthase|nr:tRNA pseudouridine(38-40) synthase TruA [Propionibacteriaceae bacterium]